MHIRYEEKNRYPEEGGNIMGKYGSGISFGRACSMEKEEIRQALSGRILARVTEDGTPEYVPGSKEECDKVVLHAYDEAVFQAMQSMASGRALEEMYFAHTGEMPSMLEYTSIVMEERTKDTDYTFEESDD